MMSISEKYKAFQSSPRTKLVGLAIFLIALGYGVDKLLNFFLPPLFSQTPTYVTNFAIIGNIFLLILPAVFLTWASFRAFFKFCPVLGKQLGPVLIALMESSSSNRKNKAINSDEALEQSLFLTKEFLKFITISAAMMVYLLFISKSYFPLKAQLKAQLPFYAEEFGILAFYAFQFFAQVLAFLILTSGLLAAGVALYNTKLIKIFEKYKSTKAESTIRAIREIDNSQAQSLQSQQDAVSSSSEETIFNATTKDDSTGNDGGEAGSSSADEIAFNATALPLVLDGGGQTLTCISAQEDTKGNLVADFIYIKPLDTEVVLQRLAAIPFERVTEQLAYGNFEQVVEELNQALKTKQSYSYFSTANNSSATKFLNLLSNPNITSATSETQEDQRLLMYRRFILNYSDEPMLQIAAINGLEKIGGTSAVLILTERIKNSFVCREVINHAITALASLTEAGGLLALSAMLGKDKSFFHEKLRALLMAWATKTKTQLELACTMEIAVSSHFQENSFSKDMGALVHSGFEDILYGQILVLLTPFYSDYKVKLKGPKAQAIPKELEEAKAYAITRLPGLLELLAEDDNA